MGIINWSRTYTNDIGGTLYIEGRRRIFGRRIINLCYYDKVRWHQAPVDEMDDLESLSQWLRKQEELHRSMVR